MYALAGYRWFNFKFPAMFRTLNPRGNIFCRIRLELSAFGTVSIAGVTNPRASSLAASLRTETSVEIPQASRMP
jgi:hypothetical protein